MTKLPTDLYCWPSKLDDSDEEHKKLWNICAFKLPEYGKMVRIFDQRFKQDNIGCLHKTHDSLLWRVAIGTVIVNIPFEFIVKWMDIDD